MKSPNTRSRATGRVTLADVAALAKVSPITVSRALRGERAVASDLTDRVKAAALKLGYTPDPAARALASRHSDHVAVLIPMLSNNLFVDVLESIQKTLRHAGYQTLIGITHYNTQEEEQLLREQLQHRPAGILVTGLDRSDAARALIEKSGIPCVHMMELAQSHDVNSVGFSQTQAASTLTEHLLSRGRQRIAFAAAQLDPRTMQRLEGWRKTLKVAKLYYKALSYTNKSASSMALGGEMLQHIMAKDPSIDAIFFCNDDLAQGALLAAQRMKIKVPQQLAIAGFNDLTGSDLIGPGLTTIRTPRAAIGEAAAKMLLALMRDEDVAAPSVDVGYELMVRGST
jgi:LacI family transcriptional regulator, gluconate utilization system Gnt-I transcriptional repressor